jgi:hypothetical protein
MRSLPHGWIVTAALVLQVAVVTAKDPDKSVTPKTPGQGPAAKDPKATQLEKMDLPPGTVLVPYEMIKGSGQLLPMILIRPEKYREMQERIKELERRLRPSRVTPQGCKLTGRVEGDFVNFQADLKLITDEPRTVVTLGFKGALLTTDPDLDGRMPVLTYGEDDGYQVQVDKEGQHHLILQMKVPVAARRLEALAAGAERSFELGLPGSAVTSLTLELLSPVKEIRWKGVGYLPVRPGLWEFTPGTAPSLKLLWREPITVPGGSPRSAHWDTKVTLLEELALTTARLTVEDPRGNRGEWRIGAPSGADLKVIAPEGVNYNVGPVDSTTFVVKGPATEHLEVLVTSRRSRPFARLPVGPFVLLGADRQEGTIEIEADPEALWGQRLSFHPLLGNVRRQDLSRTEPGNLVARFQYWTGPEAGRPGGTRKAPVEVEVRPAASQVEAAVDHTLRLHAGDDGCQIVVETRIRATPMHSGADFLDVQLPRSRPAALPALMLLAGLTPIGLPQGLVDTALLGSLEQLWPIQVVQEFRWEGEGPAVDKQPVSGQGRLRIRLPRSPGKEFSGVLKGTYTLKAGLRQARLELPRPVTALDRGGVLKVEADQGFKLVVPGNEGEQAGPEPQRLTSAYERAPAFADLAWLPYHPEVRVRIIADVTTTNHGIAHVREEVFLPARKKEEDKRPATLKRTVRLHIPEGVNKLQVFEENRGRFKDVPTGFDRVETAADVLVLNYEFALPTRKGRVTPESGLSFRVPVLWPTEASHGLTKVRLWCEPSIVATWSDLEPGLHRWKQRSTEVVASRDSLPALVLEAEGRDLPLTVRLAGSSLPPLAAVLADWALFQVKVGEEGNRHYRCRFFLSRVDASQLDIELPIAVSRLESGPVVKLGDKRAHWNEAPSSGRVIQIEIPEEKRRAEVILEVSYVVPASAAEQDGVFRAVFHPAALRGDVYQGRVRWQVFLPPSQVALPPAGHAAAGPHWVWRGWLLAPEPATTGRELEEWLTRKRSGLQGERGSLVFWGEDSEPVTVLYFPQQLWLILCSGILLLVGLGLLAAPLSRAVFWLAVGGLTLVALAAGLAWPEVVPAVVYGCQPGLAVLVVLVAVQWLLQRRYRRQLVFMPGFTRARTASSLARGSSINQRPRETSTVDAPPGPSSSVSRSKESVS